MEVSLRLQMIRQMYVKTGFLCVTVLAGLELALVDQTGLELTEICLHLPPKCWD